MTGQWLLWAGLVALAAAALALWRSNRRLRAALAAAERRQGALVDGLEDGVVLVGRDRRIAFSNPSARRILGDRDARALGGEDGPVAITARTGRPCAGVEIGLRGEDGALRRLMLSTHALPEEAADEGPPYPVVAAFTDVTERHEATAALERTNAELAQFAYVASHDLSEPLRMVTSYLQLLRRRYGGRLDEDADEFIDYAVDGANRMRALIEDLLAYSRAGRTAEPVPIDSGLVMADVLSSLAALIADARARVELTALPWVQADRMALVQVFQNLVANALKFRQGRGAHVWIGAEEAPGGMWAFTIADDGIGIDPPHRERVFKMFQRLHDHAAYDGTGIGLAICRKIVERHGGQISAEAREGGGTVFRFTLPAASPEAPEPARGGHHAAAPA